jgi:hypothetical protein
MGREYSRQSTLVKLTSLRDICATMNFPKPDYTFEDLLLVNAPQIVAAKV